MLTNAIYANEQTEKQSNHTELKARINDFLSESALNGFSAAVLVTKDGQPLVSKGYGFSDKAQNIKNTVDTVFDIASLTKQFTAAAIMTLVEQGKLNLADPISHFFEDSSAEKANVTIHQLLTHSAGFDEYSGGDFKKLSKSEFLKQVLHSKLTFKPGSEQSYSNVGYSVLAAIIEQTSKMPYENYLQKYLFKPAAMTQTGYLLPKWNMNTVAHAYQYSIKDIGTMLERYQENGVSWNLLGNGGIHSSMTDLSKWDRALNGGKIISKESLILLYTPHVANSQSTYSNGYGWRIKTNEIGSKVITHSGSNAWFYSVIYFLPDEGITILFSTNVSDRYDSVTWVAAKIRKMVFEPEYVPSPIEQAPVVISNELAAKVNNQNMESFLSKIQLRLKEDLRDPRVLNGLGFWHMELGQKDWAMALFKLNTKLHPKDGNIWDSLGEAYIMMNQSELAEKSFEMALSLATKDNCYWCENSQNQLDKLVNKLRNK